MITLLLDQATHTSGFAVLNDADITVKDTGIVPGKLLGHGVITTPPKAQLIDRLQILRCDIRELITAYKVEELVIENTVFMRQRGGKSANVLVAVDSLCNDLSKEYKIPLYRQNPKTIKLTATGDGSAEKQEVTRAVIQIWGIPDWRIKDDNHADVLAAAYTWLHKGPEIRAKKLEKRKG